MFVFSEIQLTRKAGKEDIYKEHERRGIMQLQKGINIPDGGNPVVPDDAVP
jgi:hypothetical protein